MEFVIKISKLCNLRCSYCYEYPYLGDTKRMALEDIRILFEKTAELLQARKSHSAKFIWHGGEPLIIEPEYYHAIWQIQQEVFAPLGIDVLNSAQTNLTLLDDIYISELKHGIFYSIGVSYDAAGDYRVNIAGKPMREKILKNMKRLEEHGIPYGVITVLSDETAEIAEEVYDFFDKKGVPVNFLPLFESGSGKQPLKKSIRDERTVAAYKKLFDRWLSSPNATRIMPIDNYIDDVVQKINGDTGEKDHYNRDTDEWVWVINTDGNVYPYDDDYKPENCYGNIFTDKVYDILNSPNRQRLVAESRQRINAVCGSCEYYGYCSGYYIGDSIYPAYDEQGKMKCAIVKPVLDHISLRLEEEDLVGMLRKKPRKSPRAANRLKAKA